MQAAYNEDYLYLSIRVRDDYVIGSEPKLEQNDHVTFVFDSKYTGDRQNRDRRLIPSRTAGSAVTFRTDADSLVRSVTFAVPPRPGRVLIIRHRTPQVSNAAEQEVRSRIQGEMRFDTTNGVVSGYRLSVRIPFAYLGFETNPARSYETHVGPVRNTDFDQTFSTLGGLCTSLADGIPAVGAKLSYEGTNLEVVEASPQMVKRVRVSRQLDPNSLATLAKAAVRAVGSTSNPPMPATSAASAASALTEAPEKAPSTLAGPSGKGDERGSK